MYDNSSDFKIRTDNCNGCINMNNGYCMLFQTYIRDMSAFCVNALTRNEYDFMKEVK